VLIDFADKQLKDGKKFAAGISLWESIAELIFLAIPVILRSSMKLANVIGVDAGVFAKHAWFFSELKKDPVLLGRILREKEVQDRWLYISYLGEAIAASKGGQGLVLVLVNL